MHSENWIRRGPGDLALVTWIGDSQVTYRALWNSSGWVVTRSVSGAVAPLELARGLKEFQSVQALADGDRLLGM